MPHHNLKHYAIVADIGGTFARFSRVNLTNLQLDKIEIFPCSEFVSFESALIKYQTQHSLQDIKQVGIAIACPVVDDVVCMTNCHWTFSIQELQYSLDLYELRVMNDFTAIAMSLPVLAPHEVIQVGGGHCDPDKTRLVLGAGTGLGVASLIPDQGRYIAYSGEGGHASWGAKNEQEWFIYNYLKQQYSHVSYERLLSGQGLENLYQAVAAFQQCTVPALQAAQIISLALEKQCPIAEASVAQFFNTLGTYAGDLALTFEAFGGVYIAGGIVPRLLTVIHRSHFRSRFEEKGRFSDFNSLIPTYVVSADQPGILGAAVYLKQSLIGGLDAIS